MVMRLAEILMLASLLAVLQGCVSVGEGDSSALPWSEPQPWEGQVIGVPLQ